MDRVTILEHTLKVLQQELRDTQRETNQVLGEISKVLQGFTSGNRMALEVLNAGIENGVAELVKHNERIRKLEKLAGISEQEPETERKEGVEL